MGNTLFGSRSSFGIIAIGAAIAFALSRRADTTTVVVPPVAGHWATSLKHFYGEEEPKIPLEWTGGTSKDTAAGLVRHLQLTRQAFFKQQEREGDKLMAREPMIIMHGDQDESGWILQPRYRHQTRQQTKTLMS